MTNCDRKRPCFFIAILLGALCLWGCQDKENETITSIEQLNNPAYTIGVPEGGAGMYMAEKYLPEAEHKTFSGNASGYLAISQGKLDGFVYDRVMMEFAIASGLEDTVNASFKLSRHITCMICLLKSFLRPFQILCKLKKLT